jgi:phage terminase large subunit
LSLSPLILRKLKEWHYSPFLYAREVFHVTPTGQQADLLHKFGKIDQYGKRYSVRSGHGTGKDASGSWLIWWFMTTRIDANIICTAPTAHQLEDVLWKELNKWYRKSDFLQEEFVIQKSKIFHKSNPKGWWCVARSPSAKSSAEEQAETIAGFHAEHQLIVVDEASGVADPVYVPLAGAMTQDDNLCLLIGNPTKNIGVFHETQFDPKLSKAWCKFHWDSRESENVSKDMVDYFRDKYGEDSNIFRIRVEGNPPLDDENTFIQLSWAMSCVGNNIGVDESWPLFHAVDVARYGEDKSIILPRRGNVIYPWDSYQGMRTNELGMWVARTFEEQNSTVVGIDEIGVGGGTVDWLQTDPRGLGMENALGVRTTDVSSEPLKYYSLRDELWDKMREKCQNTQYYFPDEAVKQKTISGGIIEINIGHELANELASLKYSHTNKGQIKIESKTDAKKRGVLSPNVADALAISEYLYDIAFYKYTDREKNRKNMAGKPFKQPGPDDYGTVAGGSGQRHCWMVY